MSPGHMDSKEEEEGEGEVGEGEEEEDGQDQAGVVRDLGEELLHTPTDLERELSAIDDNLFLAYRAPSYPTF